MQPFLDVILQSPILIYYVVLNITVAMLYFVDKIKAIGGRWRIPEKMLLYPAVFGGALGGLVGMSVFRHKTKHSNFWAINGIFAAIHLVILFLLTKNGLILLLPF